MDPERVLSSGRLSAESKYPFPVVYTMHSWISSSSIPVFFIIDTILSLSESPAHHAKPHPADIARGTGMILPGTSCSLHAFSIAIASAVV